MSKKESPVLDFLLLYIWLPVCVLGSAYYYFVHKPAEREADTRQIAEIAKELESMPACSPERTALLDSLTMDELIAVSGVLTEDLNGDSVYAGMSTEELISEAARNGCSDR